MMDAFAVANVGVILLLLENLNMIASSFGVAVVVFVKGKAFAASAETDLEYVEVVP